MVDARLPNKKNPSTKKFIYQKLFGVKTKYLWVLPELVYRTYVIKMRKISDVRVARNYPYYEGYHLLIYSN